MTGAGAYAPNAGIGDVWMPLVAATLLAVLGLYIWRRHGVPVALPLAVCLLFGALWLLGLALEAAVVAPATKLVWRKFQAAWQMPCSIAMTCFALEYTYPGRWLTRRSLSLLALPPLFALLLIVINDSQLMWRSLQIQPDGTVVRAFATPGFILMGFGVGLGLVNIAAYLWLFIHSPQHRWLVTPMLFAEIAARGLYVLDVAQVAGPPRIDPVVAGLLLTGTTYTIALFGFRIFDPLPAARSTAVAQMQDGLVVFDAQWRVASLNPAAASMLSVPVAHSRGKSLHDLLHAFPDLSAHPATAAGAGTASESQGNLVNSTEITLGTGPAARRYVLDLSVLRDFRGLLIGHLLMMRDVTERRRTQATILEQQRTLATLQERERLARELHDSVAQVLAAVHLQASAARQLLAQGETFQVDQYLDALTVAALQAQTDVREYLLVAKTGFSPDRPFFLTLQEHLQQFTQQHGLPVELTVPPQLAGDGLGQAVEVQLLRIIQEALSNVRKHASAGSVRVNFSLAGSQVRVAIVDDGRGFDPSAIAGRGEGYGLRSMQERAEAVGGSLALVSGPGQGTQVVAHVPLREVHRGADAFDR